VSNFNVIPSGTRTYDECEAQNGYGFFFAGVGVACALFKIPRDFGPIGIDTVHHSVTSAGVRLSVGLEQELRIMRISKIKANP
jgi:hypothetical protein